MIEAAAIPAKVTANDRAARRLPLTENWPINRFLLKHSAIPAVPTRLHGVPPTTSISTARSSNAGQGWETLHRAVRGSPSFHAADFRNCSQKASILSPSDDALAAVRPQDGSRTPWLGDLLLTYPLLL